MATLKLILTEEAYNKIMWYAEACTTEITGFADVEYVKEEKAFRIGIVHPLLEQEGSGSEVEMSDEHIDAFNVQCIQAGMVQLPRLWWHSHVNMQAFFSGTDHQAVEDLKNETFTVALVVNKKREMRAMVKLYRPIEVLLEDVEIVVESLDSGIPQEIIDEVGEKVKNPQRHFSYTAGGGFQRVEKNDKLSKHWKTCYKGIKNCNKCAKYWKREYGSSDASVKQERAIIIPHDPENCTRGFFYCDDCIAYQESLNDQNEETLASLIGRDVEDTDGRKN